MDEIESTEGGGRTGAAGPPLTRALKLAIDELRDEVATPREGHLGRRHVSDIIRRIVHQARTDGLRAEQLVVAFRGVWNGLAPRAPGRPELWVDMLVGALITAFYEDHDAPRALTRPRE